jgi:hypothetical protein
MADRQLYRTGHQLQQLLLTAFTDGLQAWRTPGGTQAARCFAGILHPCLLHHSNQCFFLRASLQCTAECG